MESLKNETNLENTKILTNSDQYLGNINPPKAPRARSIPRYSQPPLAP